MKSKRLFALSLSPLYLLLEACSAHGPPTGTVAINMVIKLFYAEVNQVPIRP